jgi:LysM repeat protein
VDPLAEKYPGVGSYVYCLDNPIRLIDPTGMAPGDVFKTPTAAAKDFGKTYNDNSVQMGQEYGSQIYKVKGGYTYTVPNVGPSGGENGSSVTVSSAPKNSKVVADIHTHGSYSYGNYDDNNFSGKQNDPSVNKRVLNMDIGMNNASKIKGFLVTPNGSFQMYDPKTGKISMLSQDMYHDTKDPSSPKVSNPTYTSDPANYVVRRGDSLHSIAQDHNMSANEIIKQNGLKENVKVGQILIINK